MNHVITQMCYLVAAVCFILGLRGMGAAKTAKRGILLAEIGMLAAILGTLIRHEIISYHWIFLGMLIGGTIGVAISLRIPMTKMPERIALSQAFGGFAVGMVGVAEYWEHVSHDELMNLLQISATSFEVVLGAVTVMGSLVAFGKLQGILPGKPITFPGVNAFNMLVVAALLGLIGYLCLHQAAVPVFFVMLALALVLGITLVIPIGGADMPVVICLLNSYAGLAAAATGFSLKNYILIISGALDGGSGFILGMLMSKAMNRSFRNVLFGAFGSDTATSASAAGSGKSMNIAAPEDAAETLKNARSVIVIPGYGMAVSQAQYAVRDLANLLKSQGTDVKYAIHPVAGRMPGHMNVLLAEANISYDELFDLDQINDQFPATDVVLVVGANDVVNPAALDDPKSPIYGMPIFNAHLSRTVIVLKRSHNPGFAGIENGLFVKPNTMMVLGDAKKTLQAFSQEIKQLAAA